MKVSFFILPYAVRGSNTEAEKFHT